MSNGSPLARSTSFPEAMRHHLQAARQDGRPFTLAWKHAMDANPTPDEWVQILPFMRKHMEAAYNGEDSTAGRLRVEEPETSAAVPSGRVPRVTRGNGKCRSGDGCKSNGTRGFHGNLFCESHGAELERLRLGADSVGWVGSTRAARAA